MRLSSAALALAGPDGDRGELAVRAGRGGAGDRGPGRGRAVDAEAAEVARRTGRADLLAAAALGVAGGQGGFEIDLRDPDRQAVPTEGAAGTTGG